MAEPGILSDHAASGTRRLADAVRAAKIAAADRSDVVVEIREADRARLEILSETLQSVVDAVPAEDELFDFALSGGSQPRFWIDNTAHVSMARDRRTYRFLRETRLGRVTLGESADPRVVADRITDYVAERMVERDRALAVGDGFGRQFAEVPLQPASREVDDPIALPAKRRSRGALVALTWLLTGALAGAGALVGLAAWRGVPLI